MTFAPASQFHIYLPWVKHSVLNVRLFKPGEGPRRGLLCDCKISHNLGEGLFEALVPGAARAQRLERDQAEVEDEVGDGLGQHVVRPDRPREHLQQQRRHPGHV